MGLWKHTILSGNVRRGYIGIKQLLGMHTEAKKWASLEGDRARKIEAHHRSMSGDEEDIRWIESNIHQISLSDSAIAAVVIRERTGIRR